MPPLTSYDATDYNRIMLDAEASSTLDAESGKIMVSALVRGVNRSVVSPKLTAYALRSDGVVASAVMADVASVSDTPYTCEFGDLVGGCDYELTIVMTDEADHEVTLPAGSVFVGQVSIAAVCNADLTLDQTGSFVVARGSSLEATANALVVNYTVGGTAVADRDYESLSGSVVIPIGESSATIEVRQIGNTEMSSDTELTLTLAAGGYVPDPQAASVWSHHVQGPLRRPVDHHDHKARHYIDRSVVVSD